MARVAGLLFVGVLAAVLAGCQSMEESLSLRKPTARLMGVQFREADAFSATLVFDVQIVNHYPADLPLLRFDYALSSRGRRFATGSPELGIIIPVSGSQTVSLPARIDYVNTLRILGGVRPGATIPYEAQVNLLVDTPRLGSIMLPLERSGELRLPEVSEIDLGRILDAIGSR
jgi:LEA14-like dessication related protein